MDNIFCEIASYKICHEDKEELTKKVTSLMLAYKIVQQDNTSDDWKVIAKLVPEILKFIVDKPLAVQVSALQFLYKPSVLIWDYVDDYEDNKE